MTEKEGNAEQKIDFYRQELNNLRNLYEQERSAHEATRIQMLQMIGAFQTIVKAIVNATNVSQSKITEGVGELAKMSNTITTILNNIDKVAIQQQQQQQEQQQKQQTEHQQPQ